MKFGLLMKILLLTLCTLITFSLISCGEDIPDEHVHVYDENAWVVEKAPTLKEEGIESNVCTECNEKLTRPLDILGVVELKIVQNPSITEYFTGDTFIPNGLKVSAVLSDGSEVEIDNYKYSPSGELTSEVKEITVTYSGKSVTTPISVDPARKCRIANAADYEDGTLILINGYYTGDVLHESKSRMLIMDYSSDSFISLDRDAGIYKVGDRIEIYATVSSDSHGKFLTYSERNTDEASTVISNSYYIDYGTKYAYKADTSEAISSAFSGGELDIYKYITVSGIFYLYNDGDKWILHTNENADSKEETALSGGKYVSVSNLNIDGLLDKMLPYEDTDSLPGLAVKGSITALYTSEDAEGYNLTVLADDWIKIDMYDKMHDYVYELAYAFLNAGMQVDYDQYNTRRNINPTPEMATASQRVFLDCSSYVNAVYYNAFGVNVLPYEIREKSATTKNFTDYAMNNPGTADVVGFWTVADYETAEEKAALLEEIKYSLQVGDVITYRKTKGTGHSLIYVGNGKILHCANSGSYTHNESDPNKSYDTLAFGDIKTETVSNLFEFASAERYLLKSDKENFSILRPIARGLAPTEQTLCRLTIPHLNIEKSVDCGMYTSVFAGDTLIYTVTLQNIGSALIEGITFSDTLPAGTTLLSYDEGITVNGRELSWTGSLEKGKKATLTYSVTVDASALGSTISSEGTVNGLKLNTVTNTVSKVKRDLISALVTKANEYISSGASFDDPILAAKQLYLDVFGVDIFGYGSISEALADIIDVEGLSYNSDAAVIDMMMTNMCAGYAIKGSNPFHNERIRAITKEYLAIGDVILAEHSSKTVVYIYLGEGNCLAVTSKSGTATAEIISKDASRNILVTLYSYDKYAVLRPSLIIDSSDTQ